MGFLDKLFDVAKGLAPNVIGGALAGGPVGAGVGLIKGIANQVLGKLDDSDVTEEDAQRIIEDPNLYIEFKIRTQEIELAKMQEETKRLEAVNQTIQVESKSEHWPQFSWRPFNGFAYPSAVILIYFLLPMFGKTVPDVPQWIWLGWLSILGVAVWDRGKEKRAQTGEHKTGLIEGAIKAIQGK